MKEFLRNKWRTGIGILGSLLLVTGLGLAPLAAAEKDDASDQSDTPAFSAAQLDAINKAVSDKLAATQGSAPVKVGANFQFFYTHASNGKEVNGGYSSSKGQWDAFSFKRAEVFLSSTVPGDPQLMWAMSFDFAQPSFNGLGGTSGSALIYGPNNIGTTITAVNPFTLVKDMWGKVVFSPSATLFFGQNKFPQGLEGRTPTFDLDFNNYAALTTNFGNKRDIGVQLLGAKIPLGPVSIEYAFDVIQGAGQSTYDNNVDKDFAARLGVTYDKFFIGTSGYDGWEPKGARYDWGLEARWADGPLKIQVEYIMGQVNPADNATANNSVWTPLASTLNLQVNPTGYYAMASYRYQDFRLAVRFDGYNADQIAGSVFNSEMDTATIGADWFLNKDKFKFSLNWEDHYTDGLEQFNLWNAQAQFFI